jgi:hypothetical protein
MRSVQGEIFCWLPLLLLSSTSSAAYTHVADMVRQLDVVLGAEAFAICLSMLLRNACHARGVFMLFYKMSK